MADRLRWQPPLPGLAGKAGGRNQQIFIDIFAPGQAPAYLVPLEEITHDNYRILTIESRCCTFCTRTFPHPTALRKHLSEGTVQCKKAQTSQRHGGPRFTFFGWKYSQGSIDPAIRKPLMHTKYAKLEEFQNLDHSQKQIWLSKVFPAELPAQASGPHTPEVMRSQVRSPSRTTASAASSSAVATVSAHDAVHVIPAIPSTTPAGPAQFAVPIPMLSSEQPLLVRAESIASSESESGDETPATHYIPSVHLPNWEDGFATIPFHQQHTLPHDMQGYTTPLRRDRNFFKHFLLVELDAIRNANNDYFNAPTDEAEQAMRRRWDRPLHISSPASPYINSDFVDQADPSRRFYDWYATQVLKAERYPDGALRPTAHNSPSLLSSPWVRHADPEQQSPEMLAMFGAGGQLEPQQPILPYTTAYGNPLPLSAPMPEPAPSFYIHDGHTAGSDFNGSPVTPTPQNGFFHGWGL